MLKSCWECIAGSGVLGNQVNDEAYGAQVKRVQDTITPAPTWPQPRQHSETMFLLPRKLQTGDIVNISGTMTNNPKELSVSLITGNEYPDYDNIACQLDVKFPNIGSDNIILKTIKNGEHEVIHQAPNAQGSIPDLDFNFTFSVNDNTDDGGHTVAVHIGQSFFEHAVLKHYVTDIRFLTLNGDVEKVTTLDFKFA